MSTTTHIVASKPSSNPDWVTASSLKPWHIESPPRGVHKRCQDEWGTERWIRALVEIILSEQLELHGDSLVGVGVHIEVAS